MHPLAPPQTPLDPLVSPRKVMNLSLLTSDFWSVVVGVLLLGSQLSGWCARLGPPCPPPLPDLPPPERAPSAYRYALAFALVVGGLVCYHWKPRKEMCGPLREPLNAPSAQECTSPQVPTVRPMGRPRDQGCP